LPNLLHHIKTIKLSGVSPVVCINSFTTDTAEEIKVVKRAWNRPARIVRFPRIGARREGALELADMIIDACEKSNGSNSFTPTK